METPWSGVWTFPFTLPVRCRGAKSPNRRWTQGPTRTGSHCPGYPTSAKMTSLVGRGCWDVGYAKGEGILCVYVVVFDLLLYLWFDHVVVCVCVCVRVCQYITLDTRVSLVVGCCCNIIGFASQVHNLLLSPPPPGIRSSQCVCRDPCSLLRPSPPPQGAWQETQTQGEGGEWGPHPSGAEHPR